MCAITFHINTSVFIKDQPFLWSENYSIKHTPSQMGSDEEELKRPWRMPCQFGSGEGESEPIMEKDEGGEPSLCQGGRIVLNTCPERSSLVRQRRQTRPTVCLRRADLGMTRPMSGSLNLLQMKGVSIPSFTDEGR